MTTTQEIRARLEAATPGPWVWERQFDSPGEHWIAADNHQCVRVTARHDGVSSSSTRCVRADANAALIASAPTDLAYLLGEVERLRAGIEAHRHAANHGDVGQMFDAEFALWALLDEVKP